MHVLSLARRSILLSGLALGLVAAFVFLSSTPAHAATVPPSAFLNHGDWTVAQSNPRASSTRGPKLDKAQLTSGGLLILGRGFGKDRRRVRVLIDRKAVSAKAIVRVADRTIQLRGRYRAGATIQILIGNSRSGVVRVARAASSGSRQTAAPRSPTNRATTNRNANTRATTTRNRTAAASRSVSKPLSTMSERELTVWAQAQKAAGKTAQQVLRLMKQGRVVGSRAFTVVKKIFNRPDEFMINLMKSVGYGFRSFADNFRSHVSRGLTEWLLKALIDAGYDTRELTFDFKGVFKLGLWTMAIAYRNIGLKVDRYMPSIIKEYGMKGLDVVRGMAQRGFSPADIWRAVKAGVRAPTQRIVGWMADAGLSATQIAIAAKNAGRATAAQVVSALRAKFPIDATASAVVQTFSLTGETATKALIGGGYGVAATAQWVWNRFSPGLASMIRWLKRTGVSAANAVSAGKSLPGATGQQLMNAMKSAGYPLSSSVSAMKSRMNASLNQAVKWAVGAGFPLPSIASAVKSAYNKGAADVARAFAAANVRVDKIVDAIARAFSMTLASAGQLVASLGIR